MIQAYGTYGSLTTQLSKVASTYIPGLAAYSYATDTRVWSTQRLVRTFADFRAMADWALEQAGIERASAKGGFDAARKQLKAIFPDQTPIPISFDRLVSLLSSTPKIQARVKAKQQEYHNNVVAKLDTEATYVAPSSTTTNTQTPEVALLEERSFPWIPVAFGVAFIGGVAYFLIQKKGTA